MNPKSYRLLLTVFILISVISAPQRAIATTDIYEPTEVLNLLRLFLSSEKFTSDVATYIGSGCVWNDELIWSGGGEEIKKGVFKFGGQVSVNYITKSSKVLQAQYSFTTLWGPGNDDRSLENLSGGISAGQIVECE